MTCLLPIKVVVSERIFRLGACMNKYVFLSIAFMAFAFYELSGGSDFVPRKADIIAAAKAAEEDAQSRDTRQTRLEQVTPRTQATYTPVTLRTVQPEPEPVVPARRTVEPQPPVQQPAPTLVSLGEDADQFAQQFERITLQQTDAIPIEVAPVPEPVLDIRQVAGSRVNMRDGPGTGYGIVTSLTEGTEVEVIETDGAGWVKLRTTDDQFVGWMAEYLLTSPTG